MKRKKLGLYGRIMNNPAAPSFFDRVDADLDSGKLSPRVVATLVVAVPIAYAMGVLAFSLTGY
ncbi:hypothetical protein A2907_02430 [Candidatus Azambacteria bacterium RIFCSPLOWO2_01_FULL_37_9]|uniref:Uncharacterized protein n=1 Tax=Candidatus Azambacteria bacterium RIFCSPLOWO2_01_FULL_37_9 TaxID=1797297 RepID=A0A1F5C796_9BACT|nr:MAG: hypothetical protein A2907_02430 [Candidatus Azambacteria bacterium RIFCSPLOWO2_01_FULL_37_9]